jgi:hypothetical protein
VARKCESYGPRDQLDAGETRDVVQPLRSPLPILSRHSQQGSTTQYHTFLDIHDDACSTWTKEAWLSDFVTDVGVGKTVTGGKLNSEGAPPRDASINPWSCLGGCRMCTCPGRTRSRAGSCARVSKRAPGHAAQRPTNATACEECGAEICVLVHAIRCL